MPNDNWLVSHWMSRNVISLAPGSTLAQVIDHMEEHHIRHIPITDREHLVGIVSDRDMSRFLPTRKTIKTGSTSTYGKQLMELTVESVMTSDPLTIKPTATLREASMIIIREKVGALPVVEDGKLVGIISSQDLLWAFIDNFESLRSALEM